MVRTILKEKQSAVSRPSFKSKNIFPFLLLAFDTICLSIRRYSNEEAQALKNSVKQETSGVASTIKDKMHQAADALEHRMNDMKEKFGDTVSSVTGNTEDNSQPINARAVWEATRSQKQKNDENSTRKSQLIDESFGDNPKESIPRMEKQTVPDPLDTPH